MQDILINAEESWVAACIVCSNKEINLSPKCAPINSTRAPAVRYARARVKVFSWFCIAETKHWYNESVMSVSIMLCSSQYSLNTVPHM